MTDQLEHLKTALADRYTIEREIGAGGMATVYLAQDLKHRRQVAIKVLRPELAASLGVERFMREIEIAANLTHPHILPLFDSGEADGFLYYVMPFIEGESLRQRLEREVKLDVQEGIRLTDQIASALSHAHERGLVHRDIKPENILLAGDQAIVADFGIARAVEAAGGERLTGTGLALGTPAYMSPEQAFGEAKIDGRSDVYALGCVVYEMVAGRAPFEGTTPQELLAKHAVEAVPSLRTSDPQVPLFLERAVERALAKSPDERFQTASEFAGALTAETVVARVGRRRWQRRAVVGAVAGVIVVAAAWVLFTLGGGPAYERLAVLPPDNLMNDPEQEYFVAGVHNALILELQQAGVAVIARTSVLQYEDTQTPIREIARELDVDALIEASVSRAGDSVEIQVAVVDGRTQQYVGDRITRRSDLRNVERLYRGLTGAIAAEIQLALTPQAEAHLASARPVNAQVYDAYLKGLFLANRFTPTDMDQALEYFEQALLLDSTYALAQTGIATVWIYRASVSLTTPREAAAHASVAIRQALALDSTLAEVQYLVAANRHWLEWDWMGAEAAYLKTIEINPSYMNVRAGYSIFLTWMGRLEEARIQMELALALDPLNATLKAVNGHLLCHERRYAEGIEELQAALRIEPNHPVAYSNLAWAYHMTGNYDGALAMLRKLFPGDQELDVALDRGYAEGGYRTALRRYAETLAARPEAAERLSWVVAFIYAWAGEKERTLEWLELAYQAHDPNLPAFNSEDFELVHDDPRYQELRRRMNVPQ
ncbi:MAG: protein kinase [Gemmatimonadota bacterium]|nr:MAG: protein kinase [Gemmatimonadota bacterium]